MIGECIVRRSCTLPNVIVVLPVLLAAAAPPPAIRGRFLGDLEGLGRRVRDRRVRDKRVRDQRVRDRRRVSGCMLRMTHVSR
jgi:hypothetical protein